jgi:hypothetical protein
MAVFLSPGGFCFLFLSAKAEAVAQTHHFGRKIFSTCGAAMAKRRWDH